ncbi:MAG: beta-galactosidase [Planctomycetia bacterium]|nr:beta-galactosidase [Planctomycetia bacterium]
MIGTLSALDTARVEVRKGVPVILLDGKPVRGRMFYGGPGGQNNAFLAGSEWKTFSYEFTPSRDVIQCGTVHFRFGVQPGTVYLDNIVIEEVPSKSDSKIIGKDPNRKVYTFEGGTKEYADAWCQWPIPKAIPELSIKVSSCGVDGSKGLSIAISKPKIGSLPDLHIYHHANLTFEMSKTYRISFSARCEFPEDKITNGSSKSKRTRGILVAAYKPGSPFERIDGNGVGMFRNSMTYAKEAGAPFVNFQIGLNWPKEGSPYDFKGQDSIADLILRLNPDALLIPRIPMNAPDWWLDQYPDEKLVWKGTTGPKAKKVATPSSELYRQEAGKHLAALIDHLEKKYPHNFAGYMPCGHNTGEWFYQDTWGPGINGYAPADTIAFRQWLRKKYSSNDHLRKAWRDRSVDLDTVNVPASEYRFEVRKKMFNDVRLDPKGRSLLDFNEFLQDMMADTVLHFAKICREHSQGKKLVVFFYGYLYEFARVPNGPAIAGHYALSRLLKSPDIDILCSPISYNDRRSGGYAPSMTAGESVLQAGKLWLFEDDTRTYLATENVMLPGMLPKEETLEMTQNVLLRNTAQCAMKNYAAWWMDLFQHGWYDDPKLWKEMKRLEVIDNYFLENPTPFQPDIITFVDEKSMISLPNNQISSPMIYLGRIPFGRTGAPYGMSLISDLMNGSVNGKLNAFIGIARLSKEERKAIRTITADRVNLWSMDSGYLDAEEGSDRSNFMELAGFDRELIKNPNADIQITDAGKKFGLSAGWGKLNRAQYFAAAADAKGDEILAVYPNGKAAVAIRKTDKGGYSIFCGVPELTSELIRSAARLAGAHLFTDVDCNVYANGPFVVLHGAQNGDLTLDTGRPGKIFDVLEKKEIGTGPKIRISLKKGETKIFQFELKP